MIVLKHLAREFDIDPYPLRQILRAANIPTTNGRYQWQENDPSLKTTRALLGKLISGSGASTVASSASRHTKSSAATRSKGKKT